MLQTEVEELSKELDLGTMLEFDQTVVVTVALQHIRQKIYYEESVGVQVPMKIRMSSYKRAIWRVNAHQGSSKAYTVTYFGVMVLLLNHFSTVDVTTTIIVSGMFYYAYCVHFRHEACRILEAWIKLWDFGFKQLPLCVQLPLVKIVGTELGKPDFVKSFTKFASIHADRKRKLQVITELKFDQARKNINSTSTEVKQTPPLPEQVSLPLKVQTRSALELYRWGKLRRKDEMIGIGTLVTSVMLAIVAMSFLPRVHSRTDA